MFTESLIVIIDALVTAPATTDLRAVMILTRNQIQEPTTNHPVQPLSLFFFCFSAPCCQIFLSMGARVRHRRSPSRFECVLTSSGTERCLSVMTSWRVVMVSGERYLDSGSRQTSAGRDLWRDLRIVGTTSDLVGGSKLE